MLFTIVSTTFSIDEAATVVETGENNIHIEQACSLLLSLLLNLDNKL